MGLRPQLLLGGAFFLLSACILVVPSAEPGGPRCRFAGIESTCGQCLADRCAAAVDACCLDDACGGVIADVESCAAGTAEACTRLADPNDRGGVHAELSTCVASQCSAPCGFARNVTRCKRPYATSIDTCECEIGPEPNDVECTEVGHPNLRCCAPDGWPAPVRTCECLEILCVATGGGCLCQLTPMDDRDRSTECNGTTCCYDPMLNSCSCGASPCRPDETQVPTCTIDQIACRPGLHRVESCTIPKDGGG